MGGIKADEFRAPQRTGKADQKEGAVAQACEVVATDLDQLFDLGGGQRSRPPCRLAVGARDTA